MNNKVNIESEETNPWVIVAPMLVVQAYLWGTVAVFTWGPWIWHVQHPNAFYGYITLAHLALGTGYLIGIRHIARPYAGRFSVQWLLKLGIVVTLLVFIPTLRYRTGSWTPNLGLAIESPGAAYMSSASARFTSGAVPIVEYVRFFLGPLLVIHLPIGVFYFKEISTIYRVGLYAAISSVVVIFVAMGTNKAIADTLFLTFIVMMASWAAGKISLSWRRLGLFFGGIAVGSILFFNFFAAGMMSRSGGVMIAGAIPAIEATADFEHPLIRNLEPSGQAGILGLALYTSAGYQGLALALDEPFVPCYGVGNSFFLTRQTERLTGINDISGRTYPERIYRKTGWDSRTFFVSVYPWIASDFSFPGSILIVFIIGILFGKIWKEVLHGTNPFAIIIFAMLNIMLFYFPANNQIFQDGEGITAFICIYMAWRFTGSPAKPIPIRHA